MPQPKIQPLHPEQPQSAQPMPATGAPRRHRVHRRRLVTLLATFLVICGFGGYQLFSTRQAITTQTAAVDSAKAGLAKVKAKKSDLKVQIDQLKNEEYLAKLVRERYMMSKPGETVFSLPDLPTTR
ncbi:FtsB family cell division protein [Lacticaseibacillus absianus]|uniref:FtsB family cell division protein n=1 Tax=Lacticaseibacillus absianus TaxID=2729623 RepID=UPI0015C991A8|nr:septum formation initiator family protein [Lacticaseibacillus absianus]